MNEMCHARHNVVVRERARSRILARRPGSSQLRVAAARSAACSAVPTRVDLSAGLLPDAVVPRVQRREPPGLNFRRSVRTVRKAAHPGGSLLRASVQSPPRAKSIGLSALSQRIGIGAGPNT